MMNNVIFLGRYQLFKWGKSFNYKVKSNASTISCNDWLKFYWLITTVKVWCITVPLIDFFFFSVISKNQFIYLTNLLFFLLFHLSWNLKKNITLFTANDQDIQATEKKVLRKHARPLKKTLNWKKKSKTLFLAVDSLKLRCSSYS